MVQVLRALLVTGLFFLAELGLRARGSTVQDYQAWSGAPGPDADVHFEFGRPFLVASLKAGGSALYAPHAFRSSTGEIFLGYYTYSDGWGPDPFPAALLRSASNGMTWQSLGERGNLGYMLGESSDKGVWAVDCMWNGESGGDGVYPARKYAAGGSGKKEVVRVRLQGFGPEQAPYFHLTRMVRAQKGYLITVAFSVTKGRTHAMFYADHPLPGPTRIVCLRSDDEGKSWRFASNVALGNMIADGQSRNISVSEPFAEALPDGRLLCLYRTEGEHGTGEIMQSWSSDSGMTWTEPVSSGVIGVDPCLLQMRDGALLCSFGRPDIRLMYSLDGGAHWKGKTVLYRYSHSHDSSKGEARPWSHAYTSIVPLSADRLLYFFDIHEHKVPWAGLLPAEPSGPEERTNSIFAVPIRVVRRER